MKIKTKVVIDIATDRVLHEDSFEYKGPLALAVGTSIVKVAEQAVKGGTLEWWRFSLDPASIAAAAQGIETVAIPGARVGDPCFASPEAVDANVLPVGAAVTADNVVSIYIDNNITVTTAVDGAAKTWNLQILKRSISPTIP